MNFLFEDEFENGCEMLERKRRREGKDNQKDTEKERQARRQLFETTNRPFEGLPNLGSNFIEYKIVHEHLKADKMPPWKYPQTSRDKIEIEPMRLAFLPPVKTSPILHPRSYNKNGDVTSVVRRIRGLREIYKKRLHVEYLKNVETERELVVSYKSKLKKAGGSDLQLEKERRFRTAAPGGGDDKRHKKHKKDSKDTLSVEKTSIMDKEPSLIQIFPPEADVSKRMKKKRRKKKRVLYLVQDTGEVIREDEVAQVLQEFVVKKKPKKLKKDMKVLYLDIETAEYVEEKDAAEAEVLHELLLKVKKPKPSQGKTTEEVHDEVNRSRSTTTTRRDNDDATNPCWINRSEESDFEDNPVFIGAVDSHLLTRKVQEKKQAQATAADLEKNNMRIKLQQNYLNNNNNLRTSPHAGSVTSGLLRSTKNLYTDFSMSEMEESPTFVGAIDSQILTRKVQEKKRVQAVVAVREVSNIKLQQMDHEDYLNNNSPRTSPNTAVLKYGPSPSGTGYVNRLSGWKDTIINMDEWGDHFIDQEPIANHFQQLKQTVYGAGAIQSESHHPDHNHHFAGAIQPEVHPPDHNHYVAGAIQPEFHHPDPPHHVAGAIQSESHHPDHNHHVAGAIQSKSHHPPRGNKDTLQMSLSEHLCSCCCTLS